MGRKRINQERITARFPADTLERIERLLQEKETEAQFVRDAVLKEITRRAKAQSKSKVISSNNLNGVTFIKSDVP